MDVSKSKSKEVKMIINFDKVYERDVDLYVINNFSNNHTFLDLFLKKIDKENYTVLSAESSLSDENGESDITIVIEKNGHKIGLLIEDKIDALAMPNQSGRYFIRGEKGIRDGKYDEFYVFIIAPRDYLASNSEAKKYPYQISYEELLEAVPDEYGKALINKALEIKKKGYEPIEDKKATKFWQEYYNYIDNNYKNRIDIYKTEGPRGSKAGWPRIRTKDKRVYIMHKSDRGCIDLTFDGMAEHYKEFWNYIEPLLEEGMTIQKTSKSMAIRMEVPPLDFQNDFAIYTNEMKEIMDKIVYLEEFLYKKIDVDELYEMILKK